MKVWKRHLAAVLPIVFLVFVSNALADPISVTNASFEILPAGGLPNTAGCGAVVGCDYNSGAVSGWTTSGTAGQFQPGTPPNQFFSSLTDGITIAYSNGGTISQTVADTVQLGVTYTLMVDLGLRGDLANNFVSGADLLINGVQYAATGVNPVAGGWSTFTATYTGVSADVGDAITIELTTTSGGGQGEFDNVRLSNSLSSGQPVPEPASLSGLALALMGAAVFARRKRIDQRA